LKKSNMEEHRDTYNSPRWSAEFLDCSMPLTFDQYNLCTYRCQYCFSFYQRIHMKDYQENNAKYVNVQKVKDIFLHSDDSQFGEYVKARMPLQWGGRFNNIGVEHDFNKLDGGIQAVMTNIEREKLNIVEVMEMVNKYPMFCAFNKARKGRTEIRLFDKRKR